MREAVLLALQTVHQAAQAAGRLRAIVTAAVEQAGRILTGQVARQRLRPVEVYERPPVPDAQRKHPQALRGKRSVPVAQLPEQLCLIRRIAAEQAGGFQPGERRRAEANDLIFGHIVSSFSFRMPRFPADSPVFCG